MKLKHKIISGSVLIYGITLLVLWMMPLFKTENVDVLRSDTGVKITSIHEMNLGYAMIVFGFLIIVVIGIARLSKLDRSEEE